MATFDELVAEALSAPFTGWDFSWLMTRSTAGKLPWNYRKEVARHAAGTSTMLDMGTGGGERLARTSSRPGRTIATEAWLPNVSVAAARLRPLGIPVVQDEGAPSNFSQDGTERGRLPFRDGAFGLVINRHEAFRAAEVSRVLADGGTFLTQQVDWHNDDDLFDLLGLTAPSRPDSWLPLARRQAEEAGLAVRAAVRGEERYDFHDVGAIVYYLRIVSWAIPSYTLEAYEPVLRAAHAEPGRWPVLVRARRFLLIADKPASAS